jgi:hypothetical protein
MRGFGGGLNPSWPQVEQQASMAEQQDKEDVDNGDMHVQNHATISSGDLVSKNGETFPIFSSNEATAPPAVEKIFANSKNDENVEKLIEAFKNCTLKESDSKSMQSGVSSDPPIFGSDDCTSGSGSDTDHIKVLIFYDTDEELENCAVNSENIVMLGRTITLNDNNIRLCYDSGAAFSVKHESDAAPTHISEYSVQSGKSVSGEAAQMENFPVVKINVYHNPEGGWQVQLSMGLDKNQFSFSIAAVKEGEGPWLDFCWLRMVEPCGCYYRRLRLRFFPCLCDNLLHDVTFSDGGHCWPLFGLHGPAGHCWSTLSSCGPWRPLRGFYSPAGHCQPTHSSFPYCRPLRSLYGPAGPCGSSRSFFEQRQPLCGLAGFASPSRPLHGRTGSSGSCQPARGFLGPSRTSRGFFGPSQRPFGLVRPRQPSTGFSASSQTSRRTSGLAGPGGPLHGHTGPASNCRPARGFPRPSRGLFRPSRISRGPSALAASDDSFTTRVGTKVFAFVFSRKFSRNSLFVFAKDSLVCFLAHFRQIYTFAKKFRKKRNFEKN